MKFKDHGEFGPGTLDNALTKLKLLGQVEKVDRAYKPTKKGLARIRELAARVEESTEND